MKYRIMLATSGSYYVQRRNCCGEWKKFGNFFRTKAGAREFIRDLKATEPCCDKVVEYC
jgi:hypothetical protein